MTARLRAPFPWFGGKSRVAHLVWDAFGDVPNYVEPFFGSGAVLLARPHAPRIETVNDKDAYLANFWRAVHADPEAVASWADWPVNEADLHARHRWLVDQVLFRERMLADPEFFDPKVAGWWVWGLCQWIGSGWCSKPEWVGRGAAHGAPRGVQTADGRRPNLGTGNGIWRKRVQLGKGGRGVHRAHQLPDLSGDSGAAGRGIHASGLGRKMPKADRQRPPGASAIVGWFEALADRLRRVRVCCGEWERILGPSPTVHIGLTGVFLDPPYGAEATRDAQIYAHDSPDVAPAVRRWALEHGGDPKLRIALCGYEGEHDELEGAGWRVIAWRAPGGYAVRADGRGRANRERERIWFSPHCLTTAESSPLFARATARAAEEAAS